MHIYYTNGSHLGCQTREKMETKKTEDIIVSIITLTYNHEPYIRECLDGILMQQTSFKFELLIHDDASTDNTANIIREYESKYPEIIKPIYQIENQYSKKVPIGATYLYPRAKGKYIALCEGDDYWTDPLKLQKQVDFLEANPDFVMCSHCYKEYNQSNHIFQTIWTPATSLEYQKEDLLKGYWFFHPLTVIFRKEGLNLNIYNKYPISMDAVLFYHLLKKGKGFLFKDEMGVYRVHNGGVWSGINHDKQIETEFIARFGIYDVDPCYDSAFFIKTQFFKSMSRRWMLNNFSIFIKSLKIMIKHLGLWVTFKAIVKSVLISRE